MKATLGFDPDDYDYGPATRAIRSLILEYVAIDWFEQTGAVDAELIRLFEQHNALAHERDRERFAKQVNVRVVTGGWSEFRAWCERVRTQPGWDWKFSVLKKLVLEHSKAHGWSLEIHAARLEPRQPRPGDLFMRFNDADGRAAVIWNGFLPAPALRDLPSSLVGDSAQFYFGHAQADVYSGIQWQLAESQAEQQANPFLPLLQCYRAGGYPFCLNRDTVVLFRFGADERLLPKATLLPSRK